MAARKLAMESFVEELKCPVCTDIYCEPDPNNVPKKLPCDHTFCLRCLQTIILRSLNNVLACPVCRKTSLLQDFDVSHFPTAHQVNRLIDIYHKSLEEQGQEVSPPPPATPQHPCCHIHDSQPLDLFCETCQKAVCRDCVILSCAPQKHSHEYLEELARKHSSELGRRVEPLQGLQQQISATLEDIAADDAKIEGQKREEFQKIETTYDLISQKIVEQRNPILLEADHRYKIQSEQNASKVKVLKGALESLTIAVENTESLDIIQTLTKNTRKLSEIKKNLEVLCNRIEGLLCQPKHPRDSTMKLECSPELFDLRRFLFYVGKDFKCCLSEYNLLKSLKLKQPFQIDFQLTELPSEVKIKSKLICQHSNSSISASVTKVSPYTIRLAVTPQARGQHELHILCGNSHICGSPIPVFVYVEPHQLPTLGKPKVIALEAAAAIKCFKDKIIIGNIPSTLNILEYRQQNLAFTQKISCRGINEFAIHNDCLFYSDVLHHRLVKADMNGKLLASTGEKGSQPGQFEFPNGVRINNEQVFVSDSDNGRIQVFDTDLKFVRTIGEKGDGPGQFSQLDDLVFDEDGNIYVVEYLNNRVQVLTSQGDHIRFIGTTSSGNHCLKNPISLAMYNGYIYVNTGKNCISVYTQSGTFVTSFGEGDGIHPECIDIDSNGFIYVTSNRKNVLRY